MKIENDILPFVRELDANNSLIILKDLSAQKEKLFQEYSKLNNNSKENIFGKKDGSEALFNLAEIKNVQKIGLEHFDMYAYAMIYYWLERDFNQTGKED